MKSEEYKSLSLNEFEKAAEQFDNNAPSVYNYIFECLKMID
jgi:hypothetical protein